MDGYIGRDPDSQPPDKIQERGARLLPSAAPESGDSSIESSLSESGGGLVNAAPIAPAETLCVQKLRCPDHPTSHPRDGNHPPSGASRSHGSRCSWVGVR